MADPKKDTGKAAAAGTANAKAGADKATKAAGQVFDKLKGHFEPKKVDEWQKKWLAMPENRKKYQNISDAPEVVGEELTAMVNDIIDFAQGEESGQSHVFGKIKGSIGGLFSKAKGAVQAGASQAKAGADKAKGAAGGAADKAKKAAKK